jgi:hypothetical protein
MSSGIYHRGGTSMLEKSKYNDFESSSDSIAKVVREYFPETWLWNIEILE